MSDRECAKRRHEAQSARQCENMRRHLNPFPGLERSCRNAGRDLPLNRLSRVMSPEWSWADYGHGLTTRWTRTRPGRRCGRGMRLLCGKSASEPRSFRGLKNLDLTRGKACPGYNCEVSTVCCDRRGLHPLAALRSGMTFSACLGGWMENQALASASVASAR